MEYKSCPRDEEDSLQDYLDCISLGLALNASLVRGIGSVLDQPSFQFSKDDAKLTFR